MNGQHLREFTYRWKIGKYNWDYVTCQRTKRSLIIFLTASLLHTSLFNCWHENSRTSWTFTNNHLLWCWPSTLAYHLYNNKKWVQLRRNEERRNDTNTFHFSFENDSVSLLWQWLIKPGFFQPLNSHEWPR